MIFTKSFEFLNVSKNFGFQFFQIFPNEGKIEIGRKLLKSVFDPVLKCGWIIARFRLFGKTRSKKIR